MAETQKKVAEDEASESSTSPRDWWISLLRDVIEKPMWSIGLREEGTPALEALQAHLSKNPDAVAKLLDQEKRLRTVIRVSAENGLLDTVEKAVPALKQMVAIHPFLPGHILQMDQQWRKCVSKAAETNFENIDLVEETLRLYMAMKKKHPDWTIDMWDEEPLLNYCDDCFYSPLMYACEAGHVPVAQYFHKNGATANYTAGHGLFECRDGKPKGPGFTAMHVTCMAGKVDVFKQVLVDEEDFLFSVTAFRRSSKDKWTPLMYAVKNGHTALVKCILDRGVEILVTNVKGQTALHIAASYGQVECMKEIHLKLPSESTAQTEENPYLKQDKDKWTPLMYAVKNGHTALVKCILDRGVEILVTNVKGQTALHIAASYGQVECMKEIHLKLPSESTAQTEENPYLKQDKAGFNVLHRVCYGREESVLMMKWILDVMPHLSKPDILNTEKNKKGYSLLLIACQYNNVDMVRYLLSLEGVDVSVCTADGMTGLHLAAVHEYREVAEVLLHHGISLAMKDTKYENTALHIAAKKSSVDVAQVIRLRDSDNELSKIRNKDGKTPADITPEEIIPYEIKRLGDRAIQQYKLALAKGKRKKMPRCNLIVLGEQQVGKTSLLRLLLGKCFMALLESTKGIDNELVDILTLTQICSSSWKEVNPIEQAKSHEMQFLNSMAEEIRDLVTKGKDIIKAKANVELSDLRQASQEMLVAVVDDIIKTLDEVKQASLAPSPLSLPSPCRELIQTPTMPESAIEPKPPAANIPVAGPVHHKVISPAVKPIKHHGSVFSTPVARSHQKKSKKQSKPAIFSGRLQNSCISVAKKGNEITDPILHLNTLDFAGQKLYRPMHHCFIVRRAVYLLVFNLQAVREALHSSNPDQHKAMEEIRYWLNSIHAHVHSICSETHLKRVLLVGTHKAPKDKREISEKDMADINKALYDRFALNSDIANDLRFVYPSSSTDGNASRVFAAVENSRDGDGEISRRESGAVLVQKEIHDAWNDLPFKDEVYPTSWLRLEAFFKRTQEKGITTCEEIKEVARNYNIGQDDEDELELALTFFHDTGTIVYFKRLPSLYLDPAEKKMLDTLVLLDPKWLTRLMKEVMELNKLGTGQIQNKDWIKLKEMGIARTNILKVCWNAACKGDDSCFNLLCQMLQLFCLIIPISVNNSPPSIKSLESPPLDHHNVVLAEEAMYLIPSMLPKQSIPFEKDPANYGLTFWFDFQGFLPVEIYHRLLSLMLRDQNADLEGKFSANFFQVDEVSDRNWMVQIIECKLKIFVTYANRCLPSENILLIHNYLHKICNAEGSSFEGLKYKGGPEHICPYCNWNGIWSYVSYPTVAEMSTAKEKDAQRTDGKQDAASTEVYCKKCKHCYDIDVIMDPKLVRTKPLTTKTGDFQEDVIHFDHQPTLGRLALLKTKSDKKLEIIKSVTPKWKEFGDLLEFDHDGTHLDVIEAKHLNNHPACCREMFQYWLAGNGVKPVSWKTLVSLLRNVEKNTLAEDLKQMLSDES